MIMNKKVLILSGVSLMAIATGFGALALNHNHLSLNPAKATDKTFTLNESNATTYFSNGSVQQDVSMATSVSDDIVASHKLTDSNGNAHTAFGDNGYFCRNGATISSNSKFTFEIGLNNITSINVVYGVIVGENTVASLVKCSITIYTENDALVRNSTQTIDAEGADLSAGNKTWTPPAEDEGQKFVRAVIEVSCDANSIYWGTPLFIKSMTFNWSC